MKTVTNTVIALAFSFLSTIAFSHPVEEEGTSALDLCAVAGSLGENIMKGRQNGMPLTEMLSHTQKYDGDIDWSAIALYAYQEYPRMSLPENKIIAQQDFREKVEIACIERFTQGE